MTDVGPFLGAGLSTTGRRVSIETVYVPLAAAGMAFTNVYVAMPVVGLYTGGTAAVAGLSLNGWPFGIMPTFV